MLFDVHCTRMRGIKPKVIKLLDATHFVEMCGKKIVQLYLGTTMLLSS